MASTNHTTNYNLSQFIGADKPAWLSDYNGDMGKIDAGIHNAQTTATGADGKADANTTKIGDLSTLNTTAKTSAVAAINEVNTAAGSAQATASNAQLDASAALIKANGLEEYYNVDTYVTPTATVTSGSNVFSIAYSTIKVARNTAGTFGRIYGKVDFTGTGSGDAVITLSGTGFAPETEFTVSGMCFAITNVTSGSSTTYGRYFNDVSYTFKTNGDITITMGAFNGMSGRLMFIGGLLYIKDFGD